MMNSFAMNVEWMINVIDQIIAGFPKKVRITAGFFLRKPGRDEFFPVLLASL